MKGMSLSRMGMAGALRQGVQRLAGTLSTPRCSFYKEARFTYTQNNVAACRRSNADPAVTGHKDSPGNGRSTGRPPSGHGQEVLTGRTCNEDRWEADCLWRPVVLLVAQVGARGEASKLDQARRLYFLGHLDTRHT